MKKNSFAAKIRTYRFRDEDEEKSKLDLSDKDKQSDEFYQDNLINIDSLTLDSLTSQLSESLEKRQPMFLWSKNRAIEKIRLDSERQLMLKERLDSLRIMGESMMEVRADALISKEVVALLAKKNLKKAKVEFDRIVEKSKSEMSYYQRTVEENKLSSDSLKIDNKLKEDHGTVIVDSQRTRVKMANLLRKKLKNLDIEKVPIDTLHEILMFFADELVDNIDSVAKYNKLLSDVEVNQAESLKRKADAEKKYSERDSTDLKNYIEFKNYSDSVKA